MATVVQPNVNAIVVTFDGPTERSQLGSGTISQVSWNNTQVRDAMHMLFGKLRHEEITAIEITPDGIKAKFGPAKKVG